VIFNEKVMYKNRDTTYTRNLENNGPVYVEVDDVPETPIIDTPQPKESIENNNDQQIDTLEPSTPITALRRFSRPHKFNKKYLNYILLTGEWVSENYEEA